MQVSMTVAMAKLKVLQDRMNKTMSFIVEHCARDAKYKDPLEEHGGATKIVAQEIQSFMDLQTRYEGIKRALDEANRTTKMTVHIDENGLKFHEERYLSEWLVWERVTSPVRESLFASIKMGMERKKSGAMRNVLQQGEKVEIENAVDLQYVEYQLALSHAVRIEENAAKSVLNTTTTIEIPD